MQVEVFYLARVHRQQPKHHLYDAHVDQSLERCDILRLSHDADGVKDPFEDRKEVGPDARGEVCLCQTAMRL